MSTIDAYFAGFIDGEGNIAIIRRGDHSGLRPRIQVSNTDKPILDALQETYGGYVIVKDHKNPSWKPQWMWRADYQIARDAIARMAPYLRIKRADAEAILSLPKPKRGRPKRGGGPGVRTI